MIRKLTSISIGLLFFAFCLAPVFSQELQFQREFDTIPVITDEVLLVSPFSGGISVSRPTFVDIDNDGDLDLFVGEEYGDIYFYRNTGAASSSVFVLETANFVSVGRSSVPAFVDIDNDGDFDLFVGDDFSVGTSSGTINFYRNAGTASNPVFVLQTDRFASIDVSGSAPTFADIDNDGDSDLFVGGTDGNISFYRNTGTASNPAFIFETENFASIDVGFRSVPTFVDIDNDSDFDLIIGEVTGNIHFYRNAGTASNPTFVLETDDFVSIDVSYSAPTFADTDNDGDFDLFVGELSGNVHFYKNTGIALNPVFEFESASINSSIDVGVRSAPTIVDIDADGDFDLFMGEADGNMNFYRNTGTPSEPAFIFETENFASIDVGDRSTPTFVDIDTDGDFDLFMGEVDGNINFYRNTGTPSEPAFTFETGNFASIDVGVRSTPTFVDIDADGDFDLFVGKGGDGRISFYRNTGTVFNPDFVLEAENFASIDVGLSSTPTFADIESDGDFDLFAGAGSGAFLGGGQIASRRNAGTSTNPVFISDISVFRDIDVGYDSAPAFADIDNDGDVDLFVGEYYGGLNFYRNVSIPTSVNDPDAKDFPNIFELSQNYPNPFNPETTIQYQLPKTTQVNLIIYDLVGHRVATLVDKKQQAGFYSVYWNGKDDSGRIVASGVYLYRLATREFVKVRKLTLIR